MKIEKYKVLLSIQKAFDGLVEKRMDFEAKDVKKAFNRSEVSAEIEGGNKLFLKRDQGRIDSYVNHCLLWLNMLMYKAVDKSIIRFNPIAKVGYEKSVALQQSNAGRKVVDDTPSSTIPKKRIGDKQRKETLEKYQTTFLQVPKINDRKPVFISSDVRDRLDRIVRVLGGRRMSVSGIIENIVRHHLNLYEEDFEAWRKL